MLPTIAIQKLNDHSLIPITSYTTSFASRLLQSSSGNEVLKVCNLVKSDKDIEGIAQKANVALKDT
jgi:hypothetical protein